MSSPPAWSLAGRLESGKNSALDNPGPGSYNIRDNKIFSNNTSFRMGTAPRSRMQKSDVPGPGAYHLPNKMLFDGPKYHISGRTSNSFYQANDTPGPGTYEPARSVSAQRKTPAYSLSGRHYADAKNLNPGPGAYDAKTNLLNQTMPSIRMGSAKRDDLALRTDTPGPGAYISTNDRIIVKAAPRIVFGTSKRDGLPTRSGSVPGPGTYTQPSTLVNKPISLTARRDSFKVDTKIPGPGAYDINDRFVSLRKQELVTKFGKSARDGLYGKSDTPGPGTYKTKPIDKPNPPNVRLGTSKRRPLNEATDSPGPGTYEVRAASVEGPKYSLGGRLDSSFMQRRDSPGPGAYSPSSSLYKTGGADVSFSHDKRQGIYKPADGSPGPGYYNVQTKWGGIGGKIGSGKKDTSFGNSSSPGPGHYNVPSKLADVPRYVFPDKSKLKIKPI